MTRGFRSIHSRLFLLFLGGMIGILILVSILHYTRTLDIVHSKVSELAEKNIRQTSGLFNLLLEGYDSVTKSLNSNYELTRLLQEKASNPAVEVQNERSITNIIGAAYFSRKEIVGIHIITHQGKVYSYEKQFGGVVDVKYKQSDWYQALQDSSGNMVWLGLYDRSPVNTMQNGTVFVFGRQLFDLTNHKSIGIIVIETDPAPIQKALSNVSLSPRSRAYIIGQDQRVIAATHPEDTKLDVDALPKPTSSQEVVVEDHRDQLIVASGTSMADWIIYGMTPVSDISAELKQTRKELFTVVPLLILLSAMLASLVSRTFASPFKLLIRQMKQVELGNFNGRVQVNSFEEVNQLVSSFNRMVERMDELIERIKASSVSEKNAQLQALQSQINPHFLYNTLDMIYWMLDEKGNERLSRVILALSHMFRYSSDWEAASEATLRQELAQIQHYLTIIENRLAGRVQAIIEIEEQWLDIRLPKMTIQPIIENAVKYGLEPLNRSGHLHVFAKERGNQLHIIIQDDGLGMDESTFQTVRDGLFQHEGSAALSRRTSAKKGIGLRNVDQRLAFMFGEHYGLHLDSKQGEGTTVTIVLPLPLKGEEPDESSDCG